MYPYLRLARMLIGAKFGKPLTVDETSRLRLRVMPGDLDLYPELNNGRHLTLMDLGRIDLAMRTGLTRVAHRRSWGFVVGGASIRYRRKVPPFRVITLNTQALGHDRGWFYFHQTIERGGQKCSSALVRAGLRSRDGLVPATEILKEIGPADWNPELPPWVRAWIDADELHPPM